MRWIGDNPLVVRAFRVGFRPGPGSFRIFIWIIALALIILGVSLYYTFDVRATESSAAGALLVCLVLYTVATFVIGGLQRMLVAFSRERERGTFDFLHLSTLSPSSVIWGFLMAGQLPGYVLLFFTLPVQIIAVIVMEDVARSAVFHLVCLHGMLAFYVLFLSLIFMLVGFWMKKAADLRGGAPVLAGIAMVMCTTISTAFLGGAPSSHPVSALAIPGAYHVLKSMWTRMMGMPGTTLSFFEWDMPIAIVALIVLTPLGLLTFRCLVRSFRFRDRKPISDWGAAFFVGWTLFVLTGFYWRTPVVEGERIFAFSLAGWIIINWTFTRTTRTLLTVIRRMGLAQGNIRKLIWDPESAPYRLVILLPLLLAVAGLVQGIAAPATPGAAENAQAQSGPHPIAPFLLPLFLMPMLLLSQFCKMRPKAFGVFVMIIVQGVIVWVPFVLWIFIQGRLALEEWEKVGVYAACISPMVQVAWATGVWDSSIVQPPAGLIYAIQGAYFVALLGLVSFHGKILGSIARSGTTLPTLPDDDASEPPPLPEEAAEFEASLQEETFEETSLDETTRIERGDSAP